MSLDDLRILVKNRFHSRLPQMKVNRWGFGIGAVLLCISLYQSVSYLKTPTTYHVLIVDDGNAAATNHVLAVLNTLSSHTFEVTIYTGNPFTNQIVDAHKIIEPTHPNHPVYSVTILHRAKVHGLQGIYTPSPDCDLTNPDIRSRLAEPCKFLDSYHLRFDLSEDISICRFTPLSAFIEKPVLQASTHAVQSFGPLETETSNSTTYTLKYPPLSTSSVSLLALSSPRYDDNGVFVKDPRIQPSSDMGSRIAIGVVAALGAALDGIEATVASVGRVFQKDG